MAEDSDLIIIATPLSSYENVILKINENLMLMAEPISKSVFDFSVYV